MTLFVDYKKAGVDVEAANRLVGSIKALNKKSGTSRPEAMGSIGGFSGLFKPRLGKMKEPVLVASSDGVGTKLIVANIAGKHDTIGIDLVAMNVNDLICCGAEPLFFLDYFACGKLDNSKTLEVIKGILKGCREAGATLLGGETAELPGLYNGNDYDLAGFSVGIVDKKEIINGSKITKGDVVLGIASSGLHSNGFSLVRKVFSTREMKGAFKNTLLRPTKIYVKGILETKKAIDIKGIAHITGGGFYDNIVRVLPKNKAVVINPNSWRIPDIFKIIQKRANLTNEKMYQTFNMGIGMILILSRKDASAAQKVLSRFKLNSCLIGEVVKGQKKVIV